MALHFNPPKVAWRYRTVLRRVNNRLTSGLSAPLTFVEVLGGCADKDEYGKLTSNFNPAMGVMQQTKLELGARTAAGVSNHVSVDNHFNN